MKRSFVLFALLLLLTACGSKQDVEYSVADTVFTYDGKSYNLTEREPLVNAITEVLPVGDDTHLVVVGHTGPKNNMYFIYNTDTTFEAEFPGTCLTWRDNDITTAVYADWSDIRDYNCDVIATIEMEEGEYISGLAFADDGKSLEVTVQNGESQRQQIVALPAA